MGMGTGLAMGAAAGVFGGLARVEENLEREDSYEKRRRRRLRGVAVKVLAAGYGSRCERFERGRGEGSGVDDCLLYVLVVEIETST
jgi:hypothetical protein